MSAVNQPIDDSVLAMALASGATHVVAAERAQVSERTVRRKLAEPAFRALVGDYRNHLVAAALGRMAENLTRAADTLAALLDAPEAHLRVRAARSLLSMALRLQDSVDTANRIREIELVVERNRDSRRSVAGNVRFWPVFQKMLAGER